VPVLPSNDPLNDGSIAHTGVAALKPYGRPLIARASGIQLLQELRADSFPRAGPASKLDGELELPLAWLQKAKGWSIVLLHPVTSWGLRKLDIEREKLGLRNLSKVSPQ
jgi:hypothetical protein